MKLSRRGRWAVPATALAVTGGVVAGLQIPAAQASPALPARTPAQLLASAGDATVPPLTGTVVEKTSLGLPALPQTGNPTSLSSLITGSHTLNVYYSSPQHFRLQVPQTMSETDAIRDGNTLWLWESTKNSVTKFTVPKGTARRAQENLPATPALTPQQAANAVLKAAGKTTKVSVGPTVSVAGEAAYQLILAPRDSRSLIGQVVIAVDGKYGFPLQVQVFAKGAQSPAFQVGYTQLSFTAPAPANLAFTPPPGAKVKVVDLGQGKGHAAQPGSGASASGFGTYGSDWLTVAAFPQSDLTSLGTGPASSPQPATSPSGVGALGGDSQEVLNALTGAAKPVSGPWGSGTLLKTSLVSMLITGGEVYVGAVQPSVLEAAVGHTSG
jgi:outer membrane lipoprotein-sorting protein